MSHQFTGALVVASISVYACLSLVGCGQKGSLYLPTTSPADASVIEKRNAKSHFIIGSSAIADKTPATQNVVIGSAS